MGRRCFLAGRPVLFTLAPAAQSNQDTTSWDNAQVLVQSLDSGQRTVVVQGGTDARYVSTGHLIYVRAGTLLAVPFDPVRLVTTGNPTPVADGIRQAANRLRWSSWRRGLFGRCAIRRLARRTVCVYPAGYWGRWCARTDVGRSPRARNISAGFGSGVFVPANFSRRYTNRARHPRPGTRHLGLGPGSRNVDPTHVRSRAGDFSAVDTRRKANRLRESRTGPLLARG